MSVEVSRVEDASDMQEVLDSAHKYRRDFTSHRTTEAWAQSLLEEREIDTLRDVYVARHQGRAVAVAELVDDGAGALTIAQLIVADYARFNGHGRRVSEWVHAFAHTQGLSVINLGVASLNAGAIAFWESVGFARVGRLGKGASSLILMERLVTELQGEVDALAGS